MVAELKMDTSRFTSRKTGQLLEVTFPGVTHAFLPEPLPPRWEIPDALWPLVAEARAAVAALDGIGRYMPNPELLLTPLTYREAQISSRLEGTVANPKQLLLYEIDPAAGAKLDTDLDPLKEISNYRRALSHHRSTRGEGAINLWLIRTLHRVLLQGVRGESKKPGQFRTGQVQIGSPARFVPPPSYHLQALLGNLEQSLLSPITRDPLVDAFIVHYQLEAIHPFEDGNGRVGRLLLTIMVANGCRMEHNWLYMSSYFDARRDEYFDALFNVSADGQWTEWIEFCLQGVLVQAEDTKNRSDRLLSLLSDYRERVQALEGSYRLGVIVEQLFIMPIIDRPTIAKRYGVTFPTASKDVRMLVEAGILAELEDARPTAFYSPEIVSLIYEL